MGAPVLAETQMLDWLAASQPGMERLLSRLVDIDSPSGHDEGLNLVADELAAFLEQNGVDVRRIPSGSGTPLLQAMTGTRVAGMPVLLMGHMDTVFPRGTVARRSYHPKSGRLYGPGVADMKAGLVMNAFVLAGFARFGEGWPIEGLFTVDEEVASSISRPFIQDAARRAAIVLNAEPGRANGNVVIERKGGLFLRIGVAGKPAHSGVDFEGGASAVSELAHKIVALEKLTDIAQGITVNVGLISGGQSVNTVAPNAEGGLDVRYARNAQRDCLIAQLQGIVDSTTTPGTSSTLEVMGEFQPMVPDAGARRLFATYRDAAASLGIKVDAEATGGCSDAGFTASLGIPTLCGVGPVGGGAHTEDEYVERDSLVTRAQALALTISRHRPTQPEELRRPINLRFRINGDPKFNGSLNMKTCLSGTLARLKKTTIVSAALLAATAAHAEMLPAPTVESLTTCDIKETGTAKIGVLAPLTGPTAVDATDYSRAAGIAIEEINAAGGVCGKDKRYLLEIVEADATNMRNDAVVTAFRRLNETDGLNVILTPYASTSNFEIDLMAQESMPYLISGNAESTKAIIEKDPAKYPTVWSRVPDYTGYFTDLPPLLNQYIESGKLTLPAKTVYIIGSDDPYGTTIASGLARVFKEVGWEVVGEDTVPFQSVTDWRTQLAKIREINPAVIVNTEWSASGSATFFNQFFEQPTKSLVFLQYAPSIPEFQTVTRNQAVGVVYSMLGGVIDSREDAKTISAKFAEKFGQGGYFSVAGYNAAQLYALCINQGNDPTDRAAIGACFGKLDVDTPSGRLAFDPATHLARHGNDYMQTIFYQLQEDGKPAIIAPEPVAQAPFKTSPWMQ